MKKINVGQIPTKSPISIEVETGLDDHAEGNQVETKELVHKIGASVEEIYVAIVENKIANLYGPLDNRNGDQDPIISKSQ